MGLARYEIGTMFLFYIPLLQIVGQFTEEITPTTPPSTVFLETTQSDNTAGPVNVEILEIYVSPGSGNAVNLTWGNSGQMGNENLTYGIYYGTDEGELEYPKLTTPNLSVLIQDLEYCTKYDFAVAILDNNGLEAVKPNSNTLRTIITGAEQLAPPANLTMDFEPKANPCLDIKWSAACPNVVTPIGYVVSLATSQKASWSISIYDKRIAKYKVITLPDTKRSDLIYRLPVDYGDVYEVRVSTTFPGSKAVGPLTYQIPEPLQPFKLKVTVNQEEGAFLIYWASPFVPLVIGKYYYQVFVYPGQDLEAPYEKYYVTRPVMVYKGERGEYSFCVNLATNDRKHVSQVTRPVYANLNGESYELNATFVETPDR